MSPKVTSFSARVNRARIDRNRVHPSSGVGGAGADAKSVGPQRSPVESDEKHQADGHRHSNAGWRAHVMLRPYPARGDPDCGERSEKHLIVAGNNPSKREDPPPNADGGGIAPAIRSQSGEHVELT